MSTTIRALLLVTLTSQQPTTIHVVFSNHLDVGFNERSWNDHHANEGDAACDSLYSPDGERCQPLAANVTSEYFNVFFPRAVSMSDASRRSGMRYTFMVQPWIVALFLDCANSGVRDWRKGHNEPLLNCPNASTVAKFKNAMKRGDIWMQAFPHNGSPETYDASLFDASLRIASRLASSLGISAPRTFSQRDETGMTRAILPLLNARNVSFVSLGSGGSTVGHPVLPGSNKAAPGTKTKGSGVFIWRDVASGAEVIMTADHGYGGGLHVLPRSGVALYCAWNRDNSGPSTYVNDMQVELLRKEFPNATILASSFDAFFAEAEKEKDALPIITREIGDTWLYGIPTDPLKNVQFREISRRRANCIERKLCNPEALDFVRFDRLLTLIPEHTWGLDTTFYLHDYSNWTNVQLEAAIGQPNYRLTVESWNEQRSYIKNSINLLGTINHSHRTSHTTFKKELTEALKALSPIQMEQARATKLRSMMEVPLEQATIEVFHCKAYGMSFRFGSDGSLIKLIASGQSLDDRDNGKRFGHSFAIVDSEEDSLGRVRYQTLSSDNFSTFSAIYTGHCFSKNQSMLETPECHNFHKPNMSSAYGEDTARGYTVNSPTMIRLWRSANNCSFVTEAVFLPKLHVLAGAPHTIMSSFSVTTEASLDVNISALNKTPTRLAEALWITFKPSTDAIPSADVWQLQYFGDNMVVVPKNVVEHGAVHLHALGSDGSLGTNRSGEISFKVVSLDVPIVSAGLLSPFPTALDNATIDNSTELINNWIKSGGWHFNWQNNIWNTK